MLIPLEKTHKVILQTFSVHFQVGIPNGDKRLTIKISVLDQVPGFVKSEAVVIIPRLRILLRYC